MPKKRRFRVQIDTELARVAYVTGHFALYRVWVYALRKIGDGSGWVEKGSLEKGLRRRNIKVTRRSLNRYIKQGNGLFWTYDRKTKQLYLRGAEALAWRLTHQCSDYQVETNLPGLRRMNVDLSGSIGDAIAHVYAAWIARKDKGYGVTISRDLLSNLWGVSVPAMLEWEDRARVKKITNYAQQSDTNPNNVPTHAYLCRAKSGKNFVSWRLPNAYFANVKEHRKNGNARKIRQSVKENSRKPANLIGDAESQDIRRAGGSLKLGKLYFADGGKLGKRDAFRICGSHIKNHGDDDVPHYVCLGLKLQFDGRGKRIRIYERADVSYTYKIFQMTDKDMRDYASEYHEDFRREAFIFSQILGQKV